MSKLYVQMESVQQPKKTFIAATPSTRDKCVPVRWRIVPVLLQERLTGEESPSSPRITLEEG